MYNRSNVSRTARFSRRPRFSMKSNIHESQYVKRAVVKVRDEVFTPSLAFENLEVHTALITNIKRRAYLTPTPIQDAAIPHIMQGKDVIGIANTGTGKTAAFLIPLLNKIMRDQTQRVLIIVPTRELAQQIRDELRLLSQGLNVYGAVCIGGAAMRNQILELRRSPQVVIGTPGRLKDLIERNVLRMNVFNNIVLDEVDRMVDMGFIRDIKYLVSLLPPTRQSLFFSATMSKEIKPIVESFLKDPIIVSVRTGSTAENIDQDIVRVQDSSSKISVLENLLKKGEFSKVLVFGRTKRGVEQLSRTLYQKGFKVASIHGDKPQFQRQQAIRMFKEDVVSILIATDVAARGIDIPNISHVINFDEPATYEDYIHRIGRTGRANQKGFALTFVS